MGHNAVEAARDIRCAHDEGLVDNSTINKLLKEFCLDWINFHVQTRSGRLQTGFRVGQVIWGYRIY